MDTTTATDPITVSVIIATYTERRWDSTRAAITSALGQTRRPHEVVVAVDHCLPLLDLVHQTFPDVVVVENRHQQGASGARNSAVEAATGTLLAFLDDDAVAEPEWLEQLLAPFADPVVIGTGGHLVPLWESAAPSWFPEEFGWVFGTSFLGMPETTARVRNVWSVNMAVRRSVFDAVGGFDLGFGKVGERSRPEDTDLCLRTADAYPGGQWVYVPGAIVGHLVPASRSTWRYYLRRCYLEGAGKVELARRRGPQERLTDENEYVRRTLPAGVARNLSTAARSRDGAAAGKAGAIVVGLLAAGCGAATASRSARRDTRGGPRSGRGVRKDRGGRLQQAV